MDIDLQTIRELSKLVVEHKLDVLQLGSLTIEKRKHESSKTEMSEKLSKGQDELDDLLFHSTSSPSLSLEDLEKLTITPMKNRKR